MPLKNGADIPSFEGVTEWINGELGAADLVGTPALVYIWAVSCHICKDNLPRLKKWRETYGENLQMVGFHVPRQEEDTNVDLVKKTIEEFDIPDPIGIDNTHAVTEAFDNKFWPAYFLFDAQGKLCGRTAGDVGLDSMEKTLERIMAENAG